MNPSLMISSSHPSVLHLIPVVIRIRNLEAHYTWGKPFCLCLGPDLALQPYRLHEAVPSLVFLPTPIFIRVPSWGVCGA